jgi:uncharacterized protein YprB with RNaseH-like and TPR domain
MTASFDKFARVAALRPARQRVVADDLPPDSERLGALVGAAVQSNRYGEHLVARNWYSEPEACEPALEALRLLAPEISEDATDPAQWLFLDTETTGLAGGTGTYAFLVGIAWWDAGGLQVEQFFMRDHSEEYSLLLALSERLSERRVLVTFNGKSCDWPLLETRYKMTRQIRSHAPRAHLDLLHPARQLWRLHLESLRLSELERHILSNGRRLAWDRDADIPGHLIPSIYFDYLRGGAAEPVAAVFRHNAMDLRGLAALAGKIVSIVDSACHSERSEESALHDALELYGLSKLLHRRGERARAKLLYERALEAGLPRAVSRAARRELARLAKRERDYARATSLWEELAGDSTDGMEAYEQLAIYYEHHARAPERAAGLTRDALRELRRAVRAGAFDPHRYQKLKTRLEHRLARLERKARPAQSELAAI